MYRCFAFAFAFAFAKGTILATQKNCRENYQYKYKKMQNFLLISNSLMPAVIIHEKMHENKNSQNLHSFLAILFCKFLMQMQKNCFAVN